MSNLESDPMTAPAKMTRRKWLTGAAVGVAGLAGLAAAEQIASRYGLIPPDSGGVWGPGETLTYATQRLLMRSRVMAREFNPSEISKVIPVSGLPPETEPFKKLLAGGFKDWRLTVDGLVARPGMFSLEEIQRMPMRSQITHQACEEGWSFIAEWHGARLSHLLGAVGVSPQAKYVVVYAMDGTWDSLDLGDAYHAQTFLAYGLNGKTLPTQHGAPLRLRVARQLGYKSVKYLTRLSLVDSLKHVGDGTGSIQPQYGYSWFAGI